LLKPYWKRTQSLLSGKKCTVLLGHLATAHPQFSVIRALAAVIAKISQANLGYLGEANNSSGACLAGMLPHRGVAGEVIDAPGLDAQAMLTQTLKGYILLGLEPELDSCYGGAALATLKSADFVVSLNAYQTPVMENYADVILPIALFAETSGTYINNEGRWQSFKGAINPPGEARPAWKILRVLGNLFDVDGFDYQASNEVRDELHQQVGNKMATNSAAWQIPNTLTFDTAKGLQRITEIPMYSVDTNVRRASALQRTMDAKIANGVHINAKLAAQFVLIYGGQLANADLGRWHGQVELSAAT